MDLPRRRSTDDMKWWAVLLHQVTREPGGVAILLLTVFLGMVTGFIPSPITAIASELKQHEQSQLAVHARIVQILDRLEAEQSKVNRWAQIRLCLDIQNIEWRLQCLKTWNGAPIP